MTRGPAASVLLPVRDAAPWLDDALTSLLAQTFEDFEVVLQDDGSADASAAIARAFAARDARVRVEEGEAAGIVSALRRARARARAPLLVRMDADDRARPERLARLVEAARRLPGVGFFASGIRYFPRDGLSEGMRRYESWINACRTHAAIVGERFVECPMPHPAWAIRAGVYDALGGYRDGPFPEDYEFFLRAVDGGVRFHKVDAVLLDWREDPRRASRTDARYGLDRFRALKLRHLLPRLRRDGGATLFAGGGRAARRWIRALREAGVDVRPWEGEEGAIPPPAPTDVAIAFGARAEDRSRIARRLEDAGYAAGDRILPLA